ncbi:licodione synthase-like [Pyrus ussuriensis x Pyrus communis]|uniref:Licodione synthase-like n=1 Tax=Pyrus ussuriensis x Pyrus communis TaxID=2448454 RepID=A0A5N5FVA7_9ROSA|nr:licodione synthase-like [Pyrus ussuriensis x Pyrus communis]
MSATLLQFLTQYGEAVDLTMELRKLFNNVIAKMMLGNFKGSSVKAETRKLGLWDLRRELKTLIGDIRQLRKKNLKNAGGNVEEEVKNCLIFCLICWKKGVVRLRRGQICRDSHQGFNHGT